MGMSSRRPAAPRRPNEPDAQRPPVRWHGGYPLASLPSAWLPLALSLAIVAVAAAPHPAEAATPLPPIKPKDLKASPAATVTRPPLLRSAPLPPRRPPELAEEDAQAEPEAGSQETAQERPVDPGTADGFVREPVRPSQPPRMASRETAPNAAPSPGVLPAPASSAPAGPMEMPAACAELVAAGEIEASLDASVSPNPACGTFLPVRLTAVRLADGRLIPLRPAAISRCELTVAAAAWMREALAPAVAASGGALVAIRIADSYNCRPRNRVAGAKMSEHGRGNAVDVGGFELGDGRVWTVAKGGLPMSLRASMKDSACTRFSTVLGPGSDGYHEDHIHVDLAQRRNDFKLCHWNLDAGTAVASRKEKPAVGAATGTPESKGGEEAEAAGNAEAEPEAGPVAEPAATGNAAAGSSQPKIDQPKSGQSKTGQPKTGQPKTGQANTGQAKDQPRSTPSGSSSPKPTSPNATSPKAGSSTTGSSKDSGKDANAKSSKPATVQPN